MFELLDVVIEDKIATVALNRPEQANALSQKMWDEIRHCFIELDVNAEVRAIILKAHGKNFCAGMDLSVFQHIMESLPEEHGRRSEQMRLLIIALQDCFAAIDRCRKPVIAAVQGACVGAGLDMISACDIRFGLEDASFSIKEIDLGMTADVGSLQRLPNIIGDGLLRELAYTGRALEGNEAARAGLLNRTFASIDELYQYTAEMAVTIASKSPLAIRGSKEMINYARDHSLHDSLNYVATWNAGMLSQVDLMGSVMAQMQGKSASYED
ncbi:enoyl-CoA hydratase [Sinobacterium caligoides]|uniref:Enoyl-CoA hydratase n=1 Tax=Sinobacterium caligoides TaxID=933926 RepID=A0A3N2DY48_9GAMM|nr:crotonase/enoyl-CoA hydratase family protein [Sinobacterium caligoides]ROS04748.1 enoyl-CoA hydratase [Sinobacterium caligoides]